MGGWVDGWKDGKAGLRIAYSNQKLLNNLPRLGRVLGVKVALHYSWMGLYKIIFTISSVHLNISAKHFSSEWKRGGEV